MNGRPKIPIKNIYYMLCYAWNVLEQSERMEVGSERFENIYNLLARLYDNGLNILIKQGLNRYYKLQSKATSTLEGRSRFPIKQHTLSNTQMVCEYENYTDDIIFNQIIKRTIEILVKSPNLDPSLKNKLFKKKLYFTNISDIELSKPLFKQIRYNRNNYQYRLLMNISEFIYLRLTTTEDQKNLTFLDFVRDQQLQKLYEKFVLNFYRYSSRLENLSGPCAKITLAVGTKY